MLNTPRDREVAALAMLTCALWASVDDDGDPLDGYLTVDDFSPVALARLEGDLDDFVAANIADLIDLDPGQVGHDFWLTRNGHGAGFWDRGLGEVGERLSEACRPYGEVHLFWTGGVILAE